MYTVEAAWIMSITVLLILLVLSTAFQLYDNGLSYIKDMEHTWNLDPVMVFRISELMGE